MTISAAAASSCEMDTANGGWTAYDSIKIIVKLTHTIRSHSGDMAPTC
jgi:hypothetical protein